MTKKLSSFKQFLNEQEIQITPMGAAMSTPVVVEAPAEAGHVHPDMDMGTDQHDGEEASNYMFFENIKTIKRCMEELESLDPEMIDNALCNGHDWAEDHMAVAKECVEQVAHFFMNMANK